MKLDFVMHNTVGDENAQVIPGVKICAYGRSDIPCVVTDELGIADLRLPRNDDLVISYEKAGYITKHRLFHSGEDSTHGLGWWIFQTRDWYLQTIEAFNPAQKDTVDLDGRGLIGMQTGRIENLSFEISPKPADAYGPMATCVQGAKLVPCASATNNDSGVAGFMNVLPGKYRAIIEKPGLSCAPFAFPCKDGTPNCAELEVLPGVLSHASFKCQ